MPLSFQGGKVMLVRPFAVLLVVAALAVPAFAQEQRGSIEGVVRDASGAVLPGATVEVKAPTGVVLSSVSDGVGVYRFPSLAPGTYDVSATLSGFVPKTVTEVRVGLGQIKKVDFSLPLSGVTETVQVTAESPLVDVRQTARQTNIRSEQVELLPKGRDFTTLVTQAPGANNESKLGGLSIDGASAGENRYIIDGIETTDIQDGTSGTNLIADFVEEVQVKSSGYTAEYGGATGGVVNVITKSGTNQFRGTVGLQFQGSSLESARRPTLRQSLTDPANTAEYVDYPKDDETRVEPSISIGGPIAQNRAWFFGAYQPALTNTQRSVSASTAVNPSAGSFDEEQKDTSHFLTANVNSQISNSLRARMSYNNSWRRLEGLLPALAGTDATGTDYGKTQTFPNWSLGGNIDWVTSPHLFFGVKGGYRFADTNDANVPEIPRLIFSTGNNLGFPGVPASLQRSSGFQNIPSNNKVTRDQQTRLYFQADGTLYGNAAGAHQVKFGVQYDRLGNNVLSGESANLIRLRWDTPLVSGDPTTRGPYGHYQVRSNGVAPKQGLITEGDIHMNVIGLFVQDAWTINNKLTVNLGLRTEQEKVPTYTTGADIPAFGLEFPFSQKIAPRVGFAYDIKGDGNWKAFGSWGVFYDIFKLELPRGSFGGDKWLEYYYTLDSYDWQALIDTVASNQNCPPACPGRLLRGPVDFRHPSFGSDAIDPDIKPMKQQEATFGLEHQLSDVMALSVRYVHKQIDRAIEDTGSLDAQSNEIYVIANPGEGLTALAHPGVNLPLPVRDYDSVEFAFDKRMANNWYLRTSYLWSRLNGNYSGLSQSDENGRTSPNVGRLYDYPLMMFQDGGHAAYGPLPTDRPHQFKTQLIYQFKFGTSAGVNQYIASGLPVTREIGIYPPNTLPVQYLGRGSDGRTPVYSQTDLFLQHQVSMGDKSFQVFLNVLNLFNQDTAISRFSTYQYSGGVVPDEDAFYAGRETLASLITSQHVAKDPRFLMDSAFQNPLQARIGFKFTF
jgi:hypothetical protein